MSEMLKIESAALRLGGRLLFRDFSLEVRAGEWVCVTGESGCGKTSLLRAALGFLPLEAGRVSVGGEDVDGAYGGAYPETHGLRASGTVPSG